MYGGGEGGTCPCTNVHRNRLGFYSCVSCVHMLSRIVNWALVMHSCLRTFIGHSYELHVNQVGGDQMTEIMLKVS